MAAGPDETPVEFWDGRSLLHTRHLPLRSVKNARELGGLPTVDGRRIAKNRLFRTGNLHRLSTPDQRWLEDAGVRLVVDLRTAAEKERMPTDWRGADAPRILETPLMEGHPDAFGFISRALNSDPQPLAEMEAVVYRLYRVVAQDDASKLATALAALSELEAGEAAIIHCSAGKDRTGILSALLLHLVGVRQPEINDDFLLTNLHNDADAKAEAFAARLTRELGRPVTGEQLVFAEGVRLHYLQAFHAAVSETYGSLDQYLSGPLGVDAARQARLKAWLLE